MRERQGRKAWSKEYEDRRRNDPALNEANRIRSSGRWKKVRRLKLQQDPLCEDCKEHGVTTVATQVHHLKGVASHPELAFVMENLRSLCTTCHAKREARERCR
jgi:5-methylcytosine-specific restriction protein A